MCFNVFDFQLDTVCETAVDTSSHVAWRRWACSTWEWMTQRYWRRSGTLTSEKHAGVTLDSSMTLDTQVTATVRACNFHLQSSRQLRSSLPCDLHRASLVPSLVRVWITATLRITACQTLISEGYRTQPAPYTAHWRTDRLESSSVTLCMNVWHRFRDKCNLHATRNLC